MIVCIGDSLTAGQYLHHPLQAWPLLLVGYSVHPAGVSGDTTRLGLERFPAEVQAREPKAVVIQFGHNDANRWATDRGLFRVSLNAYEANLEEMIERCRVFEAWPFLCTLTPSLRNPRHAADVARYDEALRSVAERMKVEIIDVRAAFGEGDGLLMKDGLHLTADGHRRYAVEVQKALDTWLR